jgi:hypothetical protein
MTNFLNLLQGHFDKVKETRIKAYVLAAANQPSELKELSEALAPIAKELDRLIEAEATLLNGQKISYSFIASDSQHHTLPCLSISLPKTILQVFDNSQRPLNHMSSVYYYRQKHYENSEETFESTHVYQFSDLNNLLEQLAKDLAQELFSLGLLDKDIYPKKVQDTLDL